MSGLFNPTKPGRNGHRVESPAQADGVAAMGHGMKTPKGTALYAKRKSTVKTVFSPTSTV